MTTKENIKNMNADELEAFYANKSRAYRTLAEAPKGTTIYTIVRHVSRSGMQRTIAAFVIKDGQPWFLTALAGDSGCGFKTSQDHDGFKVNGTGMDMAWYTVYNIGLFVHGDGDYFHNRTI